MLRLIVGRAGTGKTHLCLEDICWELQQDPLGPPLLLLVPEEISISMERALLSRRGSKRFIEPKYWGFLPPCAGRFYKMLDGWRSHP